MTDTTAPDTGSLLGELGDVEVQLKSISALGQQVGQTLASSFRTALSGGKSLQSVLVQIGRSLADIALKAAFKPLEELAGKLAGQLFSMGMPQMPNVRPFAKGGVLAAPAYFPLQAGLGLAGEAGPEAILPLARGADGRLGVRAGGQPHISVTLNVRAQDAPSFVAAEAEVGAMLLRAVRRGTRAS